MGIAVSELMRKCHTSVKIERGISKSQRLHEATSGRKQSAEHFNITVMMSSAI